MEDINKPIPEEYIELVKEQPLLLIDSDNQEKIVQHRIESILSLYDSTEKLTQGQQDYLKALIALLHSYQSQKELVIEISGIEALKVLMEEQEVQQKDLVEKGIFKTKSIASEIINGKRNLTIEYIQKLSDFFRCSPLVFFEKKH